jgi:hypothetical protein
MTRMMHINAGRRLPTMSQACRQESADNRYVATAQPGQRENNPCAEPKACVGILYGTRRARLQPGECARLAECRVGDDRWPTGALLPVMKRGPGSRRRRAAAQGLPSCVRDRSPRRAALATHAVERRTVARRLTHRRTKGAIRPKATHRSCSVTPASTIREASKAATIVAG